MAPKPSILILLLAVAVTASPLWGLVNSHAPEEGSSHAHHHSHDGCHHSHQHHHDGNDENDPSRWGDHHSTLDHVSDGPMIAWMAPRRNEIATPMFAPVMAVLTAPACGEWQPIRRTKPPPWVLPARSSQVNRLRTVILLV